MVGLGLVLSGKVRVRVLSGRVRVRVLSGRVRVRVRVRVLVLQGL